MELPARGHQPVLMDEVLHWLRPRGAERASADVGAGAGQTFVDCTLGRAGHASRVAQLLGKDGLLIGLAVDPRNLEVARVRLKDAPCRVRLFHANFADLSDVLAEAKVDRVD